MQIGIIINKMVRDRLVCGINNIVIQKHLLAEVQLDLGASAGLIIGKCCSGAYELQGVPMEVGTHASTTEFRDQQLSTDDYIASLRKHPDTHPVCPQHSPKAKPNCNQTVKFLQNPTRWCIAVVASMQS